jgi:hypothetical protein
MKVSKYKLMLTEDGGGSFGGVPGGEGASGGGGEAQFDGFGRQIGGPAPKVEAEPKPEAKPGPTGMTAEDIARITAEAVKAVQPPAPPKQYSQDELDTMFKVWKPDASVVEQLLAGGEDALGAVTAMRDGMLQQFNTLMQYQMQIMREELMKEISPMSAYAQEQQAERAKSKFYEKHQDLKDYDAVVDMVFGQLKNEGYKAKSLDEAFDTLAGRVRTVLKLDANAGGGASPAVTQNSGQRPAPLGDGGRGGGGTNRAPASGNVFEELFTRR